MITNSKKSESKIEESKPLISIIIPVYNVAPYLKECLTSVLNQTYDKLEVLIIDDGSTDNSLQMARDICGKDSRVHIFSQTNHGQGYARNRGVSMANGAYILYVDSDDYLDDHAVEICVQNLEKEETELLLFSGSIFADDYSWSGDDNTYQREAILTDGKCHTGEEIIRAELPKVIISPCLLLTKKDFLSKYHISFREEYYHEDVAYYFKEMVCAKRVKVIPNRLYYRRMRHASTTTSAVSMKHVNGLLFAVEDMLKAVVDYKDNAVCFLQFIVFLSQHCFSMFEKVDISWEIKKKAIDIIDRFDELASEYYDDFDLLNARYSSKRILNKVLIDEERIEKDLWDIKRNYVVRNLLETTKLSDTNKNIAIVGAGKHTINLWKEYENLIGEIKANVRFFITDKSSVNETFLGYPLFSINKLDAFAPDVVIVSSVRYEREILETINVTYKTNVPIITFYENSIKRSIFISD